MPTSSVMGHASASGALPVPRGPIEAPTTATTPPTPPTPPTPATGVEPWTGTDLLTGLATRAGLHARLTQALGSATPGGEQAGLLALDLDRFQTVNDSAGIATGDAVLSRVAARIRGVVPSDAVLARISGDEFVVMLVDGSTAEATAHRLRELLSRPYAVNGQLVMLTVSIGMAMSPTDGVSADELLGAASIALHRAEATGRDRLCRFEPWMKEQVTARSSLERDLRAAVAQGWNELRRTMVMDQFEVHYQPQLTVADRRLTGFEALMRWRHPSRGLVRPDHFIPLAEEVGLIGMLGEGVLRTACAAATGWAQLPGAPPLQVAVNVSPIQLKEHRALVASVKDTLHTTGLSPHQLEIEITESALMDGAQETLRALKDLGVSLSLDDFGTGYSSLSQLAHYPFDRLKIDQSFVRDLPQAEADDDPAGRRALWMIQAIASLGAALGMSTVAEGVETEWQAGLVQRAGVTDMQGFLFSPAVPDHELPALTSRLTNPAAPPPTTTTPPSTLTTQEEN